MRADFYLAEVHEIVRWKLDDDVSGRRKVGVITLQADRSTCWHSARILATHDVASHYWRLFLCRYVRQTDDEIV